MEGETITIKKDSLWKYSTFLLVAILIVGAIVFFTAGKGTTTANVINTGAQQQQQLPAKPNTPVQVQINENDPQIGDKNAPVTVVKFSDFSCPFCAAASGDNPQYTAYMQQRDPNWQPVVTNLLKDYVATGKVKFVVKYSMGHSGGHPAQLVAWCLNDQGKFFDFYPKAFENQKDVEDLSKMIALAKTIDSVDANALQSCLDSKKYDARFDVDSAEGQKDGVQGTPAFFVNGKLIEGAVPYSQVKQVIDAELAGK